MMNDDSAELAANLEAAGYTLVATANPATLTDDDIGWLTGPGVDLFRQPAAPGMHRDVRLVQDGALTGIWMRDEPLTAGHGSAGGHVERLA